MKKLLKKLNNLEKIKCFFSIGFLYELVTNDTHSCIYWNLAYTNILRRHRVLITTILSITLKITFVGSWSTSMFKYYNQIIQTFYII